MTAPEALNRPAARWAAVGCWVAVNWILSSQPRLPLPRAEGVDKLLHMVEYAALAALLGRSLRPKILRHGLARSWGLVVLVCFLYGLADEVHQAYVPGRSCETLDAVADACGAALAAAALAASRRAPWQARVGLE